MIQEKETISRKKKTWADDKVDAIAAVIFILLFVCGMCYWLSAMPD